MVTFQNIKKYAKKANAIFKAVNILTFTALNYFATAFFIISLYHIEIYIEDL